MVGPEAWSSWYPVVIKGRLWVTKNITEDMVVKKLQERIARLKKKYKTENIEYKITRIRQIIIKEDVFHTAMNNEYA